MLPERPGMVQYHPMTTDELARRINMVSRERFSRSGGPGGQHVNKVSSRVTIWIPVDKLQLEPGELRRVRTALAGRITGEGELVLHCETSRHQEANRREVQERAVTMIDESRRPRRYRRPTRPTGAARERRLAAKKLRGRRKRERRTPPGQE